eukprot:UN06963
MFWIAIKCYVKMLLMCDKNLNIRPFEYYSAMLY